MKKEFDVAGMTCNGCVASVKRHLEAVEGVASAEVTLVPPKAVIQMDTQVTDDLLQRSVGKYKLQPIKSGESIELKPSENLPEKTLSTYKPLLIIVAFITGVSLLSQYPFTDFSWMLWMRYFMAGFFLVFSFFKLLNVEGFAESYSMYDIVAKRWKSWGYIYPFVELILGVLYLTGIALFYTNLATVVILGISTIGVVQSTMSKQKIKCACLGDVFNLPMSTVTVVEDVTMVLMALLMLFV